MTYDYHRANTYSAAFHAFKINLLNALGFAAGLVGLEWLETVTDNTFIKYGAPPILVATFAYAIHATILSDLDKGWKALSKDYAGTHTQAFFWRTMLLLGILFAIIFLIALIPAGMGLPEKTAKGLAYILAVLIGLPFYGALLALFGTMLPATVDGTNASFKASWARAKGNFWYTFLWLTAGPFVVQIVVFALIFGWAYLGWPSDTLDQSGQISIIGIGFSVMNQMGGLLVTAFAATVLCKTYFRSQAKGARPEETPGAAA